MGDGICGPRRYCWLAETHSGWMFDSGFTRLVGLTMWEACISASDSDKHPQSKGVASEALFWSCLAFDFKNYRFSQGSELQHSCCIL
jgi:hypothetical protein